MAEHTRSSYVESGDVIDLAEDIGDAFTKVHQDIAQLAESVDQVDQRLDGFAESVDQRFEQVDQRFQQVDQRLDKVDQRLDLVDEQLCDIRATQQAHGRRFTELGQVITTGFSQVSVAMTKGFANVGQRLDLAEQAVEPKHDPVVQADSDPAEVTAGSSETLASFRQQSRQTMALGSLSLDVANLQLALGSVKSEVGWLRGNVGRLDKGQQAQMAILEEIRARLN